MHAVPRRGRAIRRTNTHTGTQITIIIRLNGRNLAFQLSNRRVYSINRYSIKRDVFAVINTIWFWFWAFYSNRRVIRLNGIRLSGFHCMMNIHDRVVCRSSILGNHQTRAVVQKTGHKNNDDYDLQYITWLLSGNARSINSPEVKLPLSCNI